MAPIAHVGTYKDPDGTKKAVYTSKKGVIETTLLQNKSDRLIDVYCLPTHTYCTLGCTFCHLTNDKIKKPMVALDYNDITESLYNMWMRSGAEERENKDIELSFMGVGEPLLNLSLLTSLHEREENFLNFMGYHEASYALSTTIPNGDLKGLADYVYNEEFPLKVYFSLHSPFTEERKKLIPSMNRSIEELLDDLSYYKEKVGQNEKISLNMERFHHEASPVRIHYTLIEGINDTNRHLGEMMKILDKYKFPFKILSFNPMGNMKRSKKEQQWVNQLNQAFPELNIFSYAPPGKEIGSSCGAFTKHFYLYDIETDEEIENFREWDRKYRVD